MEREKNQTKSELRPKKAHQAVAVSNFRKNQIQLFFYKKKSTNYACDVNEN